MSIYGHFNHQYYGNKIVFPEESFLISAISFYKDNCLHISYQTELMMEKEINKYDSTAISIMHNNKVIGYVPSNKKELCKPYMDEPLKIINIKHINNNYGIRVIPKCFYNDHILENINKNYEYDI